VGILSREWTRVFSASFTGASKAIRTSARSPPTESIAAAGELPTTPEFFPASWINANFDVWIGQRGRCCRLGTIVGRAGSLRARSSRRASREGPTPRRKPPSRRSRIVARRGKGSDWCWWFGPEHSTANDAEFDALYRKHLTAVYLMLGQTGAGRLAKPIKRRPEHAVQLAPTGKLNITIDGRDTSYFEWLGAGLYSPERRGGSMHGRVFYLHETALRLRGRSLCVRIDPFAEALGELENPEFRITIGGVEEITIVVNLERGHVHGFAVEKDRLCLLNPKLVAEAAYERVLEVAIHKDQINFKGQSKLRLGVALWHGGLPVDVLPPKDSWT